MPSPPNASGTSSSLDFSLPEAPKRPQRLAGALSWLTVILLVGVIVLLLRPSEPSSSETDAKPQVESAARLEKLAEDLYGQTLYLAADRVWGEYLDEATDLNEEERARVLYRRGKCLQAGGDYDEAARRFSEVQSLPLDRDLKRRARQSLLECLSALGKEDARERTARAYAMDDDQAKVTQAVATVGGDPITRTDVVAALADGIEAQLKLRRTPIPPAQLRQQAEDLAEQQLANPDLARQALQQVILRQILYREGLARGLEQDRVVGEAVIRFRKETIASEVIEREVVTAMASIGETDMQNQYQANMETYVEPASVTFESTTFADEAAATAALSAAPETLPWQPAPAPLRDGGAVPGFGVAPEISAHLLALNEGSVSDRPLEHGGNFVIFKVTSKTAAAQLDFEAAKERVLHDLAAAKQTEVLGTLEAHLRQKFLVQVNEEALSAEAAGTAESPAAQAPAAPTDASGTK